MYRRRGRAGRSGDTASLFEANQSRAARFVGIGAQLLGGARDVHQPDLIDQADVQMTLSRAC